MFDCCSVNVTANGNCPRCGEKGKAVGTETLTHLLKEAALERLRDTSYRFCRTSSCEVVYFAADADDLFVKSDVSVRIGLKETEPLIPICYCFNFTQKDVLDEVEATGSSSISRRIAVRVQAGECACEFKNPKGSCCLGEVRAVEKEAVARRR